MKQKKENPQHKTTQNQTKETRERERERLVPGNTEQLWRFDGAAEEKRERERDTEGGLVFFFFF